MKRFVLLMSALGASALACPASRTPPTGGPTPPPIQTPTGGGESVVEGHLRRSDAGDRYVDHRFRFAVQGPAGWQARLNFPETRTRVAYLEPGNPQASCQLRVLMGGSLEPPALREELDARGRVFYLDQLAWTYGDTNFEPPTVWAASVDPAGGDRTELSFFFEWEGERMEVVGDFPLDRVSSCKPHLDRLLGSLQAVKTQADLSP